MLTFKQFIQEGKSGSGSFDRVTLSSEKVIGLIKNYCQGWVKSVATNKSIPLWRGDSNHKGAFSFGDSNDFKRTAANTTNWYTLWMDGAEEWKNFPKRSSSYICSTSEATASGYSKPHIVIPFDSAIIAAAPVHDLWIAFSHSAHRLFNGILDGNVTIADFQRLIRETAACIRQDINDTDYDLMFKDLSAITTHMLEHFFNTVSTAVNEEQAGAFEKLISITDESDKVDFVEMNFNQEAADALRAATGMPNGSFCYVVGSADLLLKVLKRNRLNSLADLYNEMFDASKFRVGKGSDLSSLVGQLYDNECWVQGKCIFINRNAASTDDLLDIADFLRHEYNINPTTIIG